MLAFFKQIRTSALRPTLTSPSLVKTKAILYMKCCMFGFCPESDPGMNPIFSLITPWPRVDSPIAVDTHSGAPGSTQLASQPAREGFVTMSASAEPV